MAFIKVSAADVVSSPKYSLTLDRNRLIHTDRYPLAMVLKLGKITVAILLSPDEIKSIGASIDAFNKLGGK